MRKGKGKGVLEIHFSPVEGLSSIAAPSQDRWLHFQALTCCVPTLPDVVIPSMLLPVAAPRCFFNSASLLPPVPLSSFLPLCYSYVLS